MTNDDQWETPPEEQPAPDAQPPMEEEEQPEAGREVAVLPQPKAMLRTNDRGYIAPTTIEEAVRMAKAVIAGGLQPSSYNDRSGKPDQNKIMLGIMSALEAGLPPLYGLRQIAIINNRPTIWGDGAVALVQSKNLIAGIEIKKIGEAPTTTDLSKWPEDFGYEVRIKRRNQGGEYVGTFTVGMAKRAKLWLSAKKAPWLEHPERMLFNRARAFALRDGFADALGGIAIREEIEDMQELEREDRHVALDLSDEPAVIAPPREEEVDG